MRRTKVAVHLFARSRHHPEDDLSPSRILPSEQNGAHILDSEKVDRIRISKLHFPKCNRIIVFFLYQWINICFFSWWIFITQDFYLVKNAPIFSRATAPTHESTLKWFIFCNYRFIEVIYSMYMTSPFRTFFSFTGLVIPTIWVKVNMGKGLLLIFGL